MSEDYTIFNKNAKAIEIVARSVPLFHFRKMKPRAGLREMESEKYVVDWSFYGRMRTYWEIP